MSQRNRMGKSVGQDMPRLNDTLPRVVDLGGGLSPFGDHPFALLWAHLWSLNDVCQQALYAMERLSVLVSEPPETPSYLREQYHLWGFLSRVKTGTDLLALILNVVFELGLGEGDCSLEKVGFSRALRRRANARHGVAEGELADTLERAHNDWIKPFYRLRNVVIHRNGLRLVGAPHPETHKYHAFVAPAGLLATAGDRQVVERLLRQLGLVEEPLTSSTAIEPVYLCEQLWARLATLVNSVLAESGPQIDNFVSEQRARPDEKPCAPGDSERAVQEYGFEGPKATSSVSWEGSMSKTLPTWAGRSKFEYSGSVAAGTEILYGKKPYRQRITAAQYHELLTHLKGATVGIGTSRTDPTPGSVGEWLQANVTKTTMASYVGPILLEEGYAERAPGVRSEIRFR